MHRLGKFERTCLSIHLFVIGSVALLNNKINYKADDFDSQVL